MKYIVILFVFFGFAQASPAQSVKTAFGTVQRFEHFHSEYVQPRHVDVWLPDGYDVSKRYAVLYMHDGQMLFDSSINWNHQEWGVDETMGKLMAEKKIQDCIVVGIWNTGTSRHSEYFPQKPFESLSSEERKMVQDALKNALKPQTEAFEPQSDLYLKFLVTELKPFIDTHFSTYRNRRSTFIAGSSMGGLISLYAVCEYPTVFGGAACLSTHWPGTINLKNNPIPDAFLSYLDKHLPNPKTNRIYFDYSDKTLDSLYEPTQLRVDALMKKKGFTYNWMTRSFPGQDHSEKAWASRLDIPTNFLLTKYGAKAYDGNPIAWQGENYWGNIKSVELTYLVDQDTSRVNTMGGTTFIYFNERWQVASTLEVRDNGDTIRRPFPVCNEYGEPVIEYWLKEDGILNSFSVNEFGDRKIQKTTAYDSYGGPSSVTEYQYSGDTTIAFKYYYNSLLKASDKKNRQMTVALYDNGNVTSSVCTQGEDIVLALATEYTKFDKYGNWTESITNGEIWGERVRFVTNRTITYYQ